MSDVPDAADATRRIRDARAELNAAIARRDLDAIAAFLLPSYHVVTARSLQRAGAEESLASWEAMFEKDPAATYERTPGEIHVNAGWGMAQEHGHWAGRLAAIDGPLDLAGVYAAKWHLDPEGKWLLQAEIFTPLSVSRPGDPK
jgi:ketosteroid isomerase-like protein